MLGLTGTTEDSRQEISKGFTSLIKVFESSSWRGIV